jgi:hypothetical protein
MMQSRSRFEDRWQPTWRLLSQGQRGSNHGGALSVEIVNGSQLQADMCAAGRKFCEEALFGMPVLYRRRVWLLVVEEGL